MSLSACGGGDSSPGNSDPPSNNPPPAPPPPPPAPTSTGVFLDAPVQGLSYSGSPSNVSGTTDADGRFEYRDGDTVTFSLGDLVLGTVAAQSVVTPVTVAQALVAANPGADAETVAVNLLVFLQSLDVDGNPENGLTFNAALAEAMAAGAINFATDAATFTTNIATLVTSLEGAVSGLDLTVVSREDATDHFVGQAELLVAGTFVGADADGNPTMQNMRTLTLFQNGRYVYGGHDNDPNCNDAGAADADGNGVEMGDFDYNPLTRAITFTPTYETNGSCGPESGEDSTYTVDIAEDLLTIDFDDDTVHFVRAPNVANQLTGSWSVGQSLLTDRPHIVTFLPSSENGLTGRYFVVDTGEPGAGPEDSGGIEEGCYTFDASGNLEADLDPATCAGAVDTNDDSGLSHSVNTNVQLDAHGQAVFTDDAGVSGLIRLPLQQFTAEHLAGHRYFEIESGTAPQTLGTMALLTVFDDGRYIMGTQEVENEAEADSCGAEDYPMNWQDGSDGAEYGTLTFVAGGYPGQITSNATLDSNGECGLFNASWGEPQQFLFVRSATEEGTLLLFTNDSGEAENDEPLAHVLKSAPSEEGSLVGVWQWDEPSDIIAGITYLLPGGVSFTIEVGDSPLLGVHRAKYSVNAGNTEFTETTGPEVEFCTDTVGTGIELMCGQPTETNVYPLVFEGDSMTIDGEGYTKLSAP